MSRSAALLAVLLAAAAAHADAPATLTLHLDLSDSVARNLQSGTIAAIKISAINPTSPFPPVDVDTTTPTATLSGVTPPGKWTIRALLLVNGHYYVVNPNGIDVDVAPGSHADVNVPVPAVIVAGSVRDRAGAPVHGQMNIWPSQCKKGNWGFAVPFDQNGRFLFPLPQEGEGKWDLTVSSSPRDVLAKIDNFEFQPDNTIEIPQSR